LRDCLRRWDERHVHSSGVMTEVRVGKEVEMKVERVGRLAMWWLSKQNDGAFHLESRWRENEWILNSTTSTLLPISITGLSKRKKIRCKNRIAKAKYELFSLVKPLGITRLFQ
jgi:hypothetical protein